MADVDDDELYLHSVGQYTLYVYGNTVSYLNVAHQRICVFYLGKSCEIWGKLDENAIALNASYGAAHRSSCGEFVGILLPRAKELLERDEYPAAIVDGANHYLYLLTGYQSVGGV